MELTPGTGQCSVVSKGVSDGIKDGMGAVFKYLQGFSVWEAAACGECPWRRRCDPKQ